MYTLDDMRIAFIAGASASMRVSTIIEAERDSIHRRYQLSFITEDEKNVALDNFCDEVYEAILAQFDTVMDTIDNEKRGY